MNHSPLPLSDPEANKSDLQKLAYHLWIDGGRLEGVELDNWLAAQELLPPRQGQARGYGFHGAHRRVALSQTSARS